MGSVLSLLTGTSVPDGAAPRKNLPTHLLAIVNALDKFVVGRHADASAGSTANPTPLAGQMRWLDSPGRHERRHPTYGWVPIGWARRLTADPPATNPSVTPPGSVAATTQPLTIGPYAFPHIIEITYQLYAVCSSAGNDFNAYLNVNGDTKDKGRAGASSATATVVASVINLGTAQSVPATVLVGGIEKVVGSDSVLARCDDPTLTKLVAVVRPYLTSAA